MKTFPGVLAVLMVGLILFAGCQGAGTTCVIKEKTVPPPWAPAYGVREKHQYYYYPSASVYFDINRKIYFYLVGGRWIMNARLPKGLVIKLDKHITLELDTDRPYRYHEKHMRKYPPGQYKKGR